MFRSVCGMLKLLCPSVVALACTWAANLISCINNKVLITLGGPQRRYDKRAPGSAWGGACGYNLSHDQLSLVDQQYTNCDPYKARLG